MSKKKASASTKGFLPLIFMTVFMSMLGVTIVIPILPALFEGTEAPFAGDFNEEERAWLFGLLLASYSVLQLIGAPILGALSDRKGRKPILTLTVLGGFIGYLLFGYAVMTGTLWLLFLARMIPGFAGGNIAIIYSAIADISEQEDKVKNFGLVGAAFGIGFMLGPWIGGVVGDAYGFAAPFWLTAALSFFNMILIQLFFPETLKNKSQKAISPFQGIKNIVGIVKIPNLRGILSIVLLISLGFTFFTQFFAFYLLREFAITKTAIGNLFLWIGVWLVITQGFLVRVLSKKYTPKQILKFTPFLLATAVFLILIPDQQWQFYLVNPLIAIAYGMTSPNMTALVSAEATPEQQGEILGINQSMSSLGHVLPPLIGGYLAGIDVRFPILAGALVLVIAGIVFHLFYGRER